MEQKKYRIHWFINAVQFGKRGKYCLNLGFCEKTGNIAFISICGTNNAIEFAKPFVIRDVYVNDECEDGERCWDLNCPHNRAKRKNFEKYLLKNAKLEDVARRIQKWGELIKKNYEIDWDEQGVVVFNDAPIIVSLPKHRKRAKTQER